MIHNLPLDPLNIRLRFRESHLALRQFRALAARDQRLGDPAPIAIHHVRLVELDFGEEVRAVGVRRWRGCVGGRLERADGRAHDEALERLAVPLPAAADLFREGLDLLHGGMLERGRGYEAPFTRERVEHAGWLGAELSRAVVDAV